MVRADQGAAERGGLRMARVPELAPDDLAPEDRDLLSRPIALFKALVNSPNCARAFSGLGGFIRNKSRLDPRLRELAILQVGWIARAPYEWSHHVAIGRRFGVSDDDIRALIAESRGDATSLDEPARLVLRAAREMTEAGEAAGPTMEGLARHLDPERLVDLVVTIAFYNAVVRVLATLQIEVEDEYGGYLREFPLPE
jgi:alkylhydroperoxidase family enzyme